MTDFGLFPPPNLDPSGPEWERNRDIDWNYWLKIPLWTLSEFVCLATGFNPNLYAHDEIKVRPAADVLRLLRGVKGTKEDAGMLSPREWVLAARNAGLTDFDELASHRGRALPVQMKVFLNLVADGPAGAACSSAPVMQSLAPIDRQGVKPASRRFATAPDLAAAFHVGGTTDAENLEWWKRRTGNATTGRKYQWLHRAIEDRGSPGKAPSTWHPAATAAALVDKKMTTYPAALAAMKKHFPEWVDDFERYREED